MKRTLALILALVMVLPVSFISALAHGPGNGKNTTENQSIHNATGQPIPETVIVDGDYTDTAWDKDEWKEADKRFGVWDVVDPIALNFNYKYQLKLDATYLYGVFRLSDTTADEITLWLNDGTGDNTYTNKIVLTLDGQNLGTVTLDGKTVEDAETTPVAGKVFPAEKFQSATKLDGNSLVVEFRICLKSFSTKKAFTHFISVKVGNEKLYYPKVALENETVPDSALLEWPSNAIVIDRVDIEDAYSNKHLPSGITIDGELTEVAWNDLTDYRLQKYTSYQQYDAVGEGGYSAPLDLLSVGYNDDSLTTTNIPAHYHPACGHCSTDYACTANALDKDEQMRFKYELRTDGNYLYGAVMVFDYGDISHNICDHYTNNGVENWKSTYAGKTHLQVNFYDASGNLLKYTTSGGGIKLSMVYNSKAEEGKRSTFGLYDGWSSYGEKKYTYSDGTTGTISYNSAMNNDKNAGSIQYTDFLYTYEFKIPLEYLDAKGATSSYKTGKGTAKTFQVEIQTYEEGAFAGVKNGSTSSGSALNANKVRKYAATQKVSVSTNNSNSVSPSYSINGGLQASEWNSVIAADSKVNGMYRGDDYNSGNVLTYQYKVTADYDYIYGAALMVVNPNSSIQCIDDFNKANALRLWLQDGSASAGSSYKSCVSFYMDKNLNTKVAIAQPKGSGGSYFATYTKSNGVYTKDSSGSDELEKLVYGLDAKMRLLNADDIPAEKRTRFANMYTAVNAGRVALVEFRIPLDLVGLDMDYYYPDNTTHPEQIRYYVNFCQGMNDNKGVVHPIQKTKQSASKYLVFTPGSWSNNGNKVIYNNEDYFDTVKIDGVRTESFWNDFSDFVGINGSSGYYSESVDAKDLFTYGNTIKVSRNHLYGYSILNALAVEGTTYTLYINNDPAYKTQATHGFEFKVTESGMVCTATDYTDPSNPVNIDVTDRVYFAYNTINGYSNIEFAIDATIFDADHSGYEYAVSAETKIGDRFVSLSYPDPRKASNECFTGLELTHVNYQYVQTGQAMIITNASDHHHDDDYSSNKKTYKLNGYANLYVVFEKVNQKSDVYIVKSVYGHRDSNYLVNDNYHFDLTGDRFLYILYTGADSSNNNNPDPARRTALYNKYKSDFKVGAIVDFQGLDLTGNDLTHTKYRVLDANNTIYVNYVNYANQVDVCQIVTKETLDTGVKLNGHADYYIAFAPTNATGLYKVVGIDDDNFFKGNNMGDGDGNVGVTLPQGGFIYSMRYEDSDVDNYAKDLLARFPVGTYVHIDDLDIQTPQAESLGYRFLAGAWEDRNHHFPSENHWENEIALAIDSLGYFYPETITIDGVTNDNGWDPNGWTYVEEGVNSALQSDDYAENGAEKTNFRYQLRTDGEYVYVAAELEVNGEGKIVESVGKDGKTSYYIAIPSFRLWIKSNDSKYQGAKSFTHLYDVRFALDDTMAGYKNYETGPTGTVQTTLTGINLTASGQVSEDLDYYFSEGKVIGPNDVVITSDKSITYSNTGLRFAEHLENGFKFPWGGNKDGNGQPTVKNYNTANGYGISALFGETEEDMESLTTGAHGDEYKWYAHTNTEGFSIANEHGKLATTTRDGEDLTVIEFKFKLDEIGCGDGDGFEYFVQAAHSGTDTSAPFTMFNPAPSHIPHQALNGFSNFNLPYWSWDSVTSSKFNATTAYNMSLRNNYGPAISLGAKVSDDYKQDGTGVNAIRFGGLYTEDYIRRQITNGANSKWDDYKDADHGDRYLTGANHDGITNYWDVTSVGIVFHFTQLLKLNGKKEVDLTLDTEGVGSAESIGIYHYKQNTNFADYENYVFYVTLHGFPDQYKGVKFSFRSYVTYYEADGSPAYYDQILERTWNQVNAGGNYVIPDELPDDGEGNGTPGVSVTKPNHNGELMAYIPLDNRPVNLDRGIFLAESAGFQLTMPNEEDIVTEINNIDTDEDDSRVGNVDNLFQWLQDTYAREDDQGNRLVKYYVISLDQLLSGGLVGSRDFAGINNITAENRKGTEYDPTLAKEKKIIEFLAKLTADPETKVVYFDSQMRLASTGQFNGFMSNDTDMNGDGYAENHYTFLRSIYTMGARPSVDLSGDDPVAEIVAGYEYYANDLPVLTTFANTTNYAIDGCYTNGVKDTTGTIYNDDGTVKNGYVQYHYTAWNPTRTVDNRIDYSMIDRYLKSRERKLRISELLFESGVIENAEYFYVGTDDSNPNASIHDVEGEWFEHMSADIDGFSFFSGIDEIGLMSIAALVTSCYGSIDTCVEYFGPGENYTADEYARNTLAQNMAVHVEGVGANIGASKINKNALHILVLTKKTTDNSAAETNDATDEAVDALITKLTTYVNAGYPVAVVDGSAGTRSKLGHAIQESGIDLGKILGYSNWNTVANATGVSVSNAVARYAYLRHSAEVTDESNEAFLRGLAYSYVKDIAYIIDYKDATPSGFEDSYENRMSYKSYFDTTAKDLIGKINKSPIMVDIGRYEDIGDIVITKDLYWPWHREFEASFGLSVVANKGANITHVDGQGVAYTYEGESYDNDSAKDDGVKLTNGLYSPSQANLDRDPFNGLYSATKDKSPATVTFDFGADMKLTTVKAVGLSGLWGIGKLGSLEVYVSNNGDDYTEVSGVYKEEISEHGDWDDCYYTYYFDEVVTARYVRIVFKPYITDNFTWLSEVEVYGSAA